MTANERQSSPFRPWRLAAAVMIAASIQPGAAHAQFGFPGLLNLPDNDFTWVWGDRYDAEARRAPDLSADALDLGFRCGLKARLSPASRLSTAEIRQLENALRTSLYFIETAANTMYQLELQRNLDWAVLDCVKQEASERSEEDQQEREAELLERAEKRREHRRAREQRQRQHESEDGEIDWRDL